MRKTRWSLWLAVLAAFALLAAACGDDEEPAPAASGVDAAALEQAQADAAAAAAAAADVQADAAAAAAAAAEAQAALEAALEAAMADTGEAVDPAVVAELERELEAAQAEAEAASAAAAAAADAAAAAAAAVEEPMVEVNMTPGAGVSVTMARANWATGYMQAEIYAQLLDALGYDVSEPSELEISPSNAYLAMADREFDFWANSWYPNHDSFVAAEMPDGSLVGDHVSKVGQEAVLGGVEAFLTNKSLVEEHGITTLESIVNNSDLFQLYEANDHEPGDGVLQLYGCPEGWGCQIIIDALIEDRGWTGMVEQLEVGGYDATIAEGVARAQEDTPFLAYTWSPSFYTSRIGLGSQSLWVALEEGAPTSLGLDVCTNVPCNVNTTADILVTANNNFLDENPAAAKMLELVEISVVDIALQNARYDAGGENTTAHIKRHAREWIVLNQDLVDGWLAEARAAA